MTKKKGQKSVGRAQISETALFCAFASALACADLAAQELADLSLEELSNIKVTSVSRRPEALSSAASSIFVITGEDIRRSGARHLPEALRLAPNLQVARINNRLYAITARGFNSNIANKLLVMIDGRTVYSPLFSGVFWDAQSVVLENVDRIEVIDGPGAATWGVNAVSGVINVITRPAAATQGVLGAAAVGNLENTGILQYGGEVGSGHWRIYGKGSKLDSTDLATGADALDGWEHGQIGFRADWRADAGAFTLQGDAYDTSSDERPVLEAIEASGFNLLGHWRRAYGADSNLDVTAYYDRSKRKDLRLLQETAEIFDVDVKYGFALDAHRLVVGAGYRHAMDDSDAGTLFAFIPDERSLDWYNVFVQDQIRLTRSLELTVGLRLEHNEYTDWETLPNVRLAWHPDGDQMVWGAVSRAVRAPARLDREIFFPASPPFIVAGGPNFVSEVAHVFELGYRATLSRTTAFSVTAFEHRYDRLRSGQFEGGNLLISNMIEGEVSGLSAWASWQARSNWRLSIGGVLLDKDLRLKPGSNDPVGPSNLGNDPDYQVLLRSSFDLSPEHQFDMLLRHVDELPLPRVPSHTALDMRFGWRPSLQWELSLTLQDVLDSSHEEFGAPLERSEFERGAFLKIQWRR